MADLVTLAQYKEAEGISSSKDDLRFNSIIPSVSELVKTYCGNSFVDFYSSNKTETFTIDWDTYVVQLTESPVNSIVSVQERETYGGSYATLTTSDSEYYLESSTDSILRTNDSGRYQNWPKGVGAVKVVYTGGYSAVPADLKLAVLDLVTYYYKDEHKQRQSIAGASLQNQGSSSQRMNVGFPDHIKRVLDLYKNY
tara:strand:- start:8107 stop:8697 length:591 start_codon:yes stop_codon:yes gene_type:complete